MESSVVETPRPRGRPKAQTALAAQEMDKVENQFQAMESDVKQLTLDRMNEAPKVESEPQLKASTAEIEKMPGTYLKPTRIIGCRDKFNDKFRARYEYDKQYVQFIAEHREILNENIEIWTRPYGGVSAEFWEVPTNKPIWGPRYLAEQIKRKTYRRLVMKENKITGHDGNGQYYGALTVDSQVERLTARPVSNNKSIFMSA